MEYSPDGPPSACDKTHMDFTVNFSLAHPKDPKRFDVLPMASLNSFQFVYPQLIRSWNRFFTLCLKFRMSFAVENVSYNMMYYQLNYAWVALILIFVAVLGVNSYDFNIALVWAVLIVFLVYALNLCWFHPRLLGRKMAISEQFAALSLLALPLSFCGFLPASFQAVIFCSVGFTCCMVAHALLTPAVNKTGFHKINHL